MKKVSLASLGALCAASLWSVSRPPDIPFTKHTLDQGANETAAIADIDNDGKLDIVSGENWYQAPSWTQHRFREVGFSNNYIDNFSDLPLDVNGDGWTDLVSCSWFAKELVWWKNPGKTRAAWTKAPIDTGMNVEFCFLVDMDGDGKAREVLPQYGGRDAYTAWYEVKDGQWIKHKVSDKSYGHGIGAGDVNNDGKIDVLTPKGWFEAPDWTHHPGWDHKEHISFMHVEDVNRDGRNDVVAGHAHDYGLFWHENLGGGKWEKRMIDDTWSQAHAVTMVDLNGDGKRDILTGKRWMAHDHENGAREPNGIYWYETLTVPGPDGKPRLQWVKHVIDYSTRAGAGMQTAVGDLDGDGDLDFVAGGKLGVFLFENRTKGKRR